MNVSNIDDFKPYCKKGLCLRQTILSNRCKTDFKQSDCYNKWRMKQAKKNKKPVTDTRWKGLVNELWERDEVCRVWACLTIKEQNHVLDKFGNQYAFLSKTLDPMHIKGKGAHIESKYDLDNLLLGARYFHTLIDAYKDPVTQEPMTKEQRDAWFERIKENNKE